MRTITPTERALIGSGRYEVHVRVEVQNADGAWKDLTNLAGVNWLQTVRWSFNIDAPVMSGTMTLRRDATVGTAGGVTYSLAPFLASGGLNVDNANAYAPLLNPGRGVRVSVATVAPGSSAAAVSAAMRLMLVGKLDDVAWEADPIAVTFRDLGAYLNDAVIETPDVYGADDGSVFAEHVIQAILDAVPSIVPPALGDGAVTLVVPAPSLFAVTRYRQEPGPLLEALRNVALTAGCDLRYAFDAANAFRLTLARPDRTKTTPDATLPPTEYLSVTAMSVSDADVRNVVQVVYTDGASKTVIAPAPTEHPGSVAAFGRRFMRLVEQATSLIDTQAEADRMAADVASDLAFPKATHAVQSFALPFAELGDLVSFPANGVHYDAPQALAVVAGEHVFGEGGPGTGRTTLACRGTPAGAYRAWLERAGGGVRIAQPGPAPEFLGAYAEASAFGGQTGDGGTWVLWRFDRRTAELRFHVEEAPVGTPFPAPTPDIHDENTLAKTVTRLPGARAGADDWGAISFLATTPEAAKTVVGYGRGFDGQLSARKTFRVQAVDPTTPAGVGDPGDFSGLSVERRPGGNVLTLTRGSTGTATAAWAVIFRNRTPIDVVPLTTAAGAASDVASGGTVTWEDPGLDTTSEQFDYEVCAWSYGISGPKTAGGTDPSTPTSPIPPPPLNPDPVVPVPPPSTVAAPQFGLHSGVQTPVEEAGGWVRVVWDRPAGATGVALEKTYRSDNTGWVEVTYSTLSHYDDRVSGAYESGYYRLVAKDAGFGYLAISAPVYYRSTADILRSAGTGTASGGGGGQTQNVV